MRLLGIDAPEKSSSERDRAFTSLGIALDRLRPGEPERNRLGRLLAYVPLADSHLLLKEGLAIVPVAPPFLPAKSSLPPRLLPASAASAFAVTDPGRR